jgi:hypothetical protein
MYPDESRVSWQYPPEFYDRLSKIWLTSGALRELNRRNRILHLLASLPRPSAPPKDLARFARRGGPDLSNLRGVMSHVG